MDESTEYTSDELNELFAQLPNAEGETPILTDDISSVDLTVSSRQAMSLETRRYIK